MAPANNNDEERNNLKFVADNSGEVTPFDWYNARIALDFKVQKHDGTNFVVPANVTGDDIAAAQGQAYRTYRDEQMGIVNFKFNFNFNFIS